MSTDNHGPVVIAVDGTDRSAGAIAYGVEEARVRKADIRVLHVGPSYVPTPTVPMGTMIAELPELWELESQELLAKAIAQVEALAPDLTVTPVRRRGSRTREILGAAAGASVLVMGRETRTGWERLATGTTTAKVAARAACPVVVVPATWEGGSDQGRIVVGIKADEHAEDLLAGAFEAAAARKATLTVLHAWKLPDPYLDRLESHENATRWLAAGEQLLERVLATPRHAHPDVVVETRVLHRQPAAALVEAGRDADLLVLARRTPEHLHISYLGGTARTVLQHATCPIEVVTAKK